MSVSVMSKRLSSKLGVLYYNLVQPVVSNMDVLQPNKIRQFFLLPEAEVEKMYLLLIKF